MSVKVGVRVRPYNQRQKDLNCKLCVEMVGPMTRLFDAEEPDKHRDFTFDYSFWSHDRFTPDQKGYFRGDDEKYADQQEVFQKVGLEILSNAWEGYHCCLFAYGQTGAGKSYSMVGYGANKGIVPISCEQIFKRISCNDNPDKEYEVNVSMLEIYNEKVQDLLIPINKRQKEGLKIREHKTLGIYVQGLSKHFVDNYDSIQSKMQEGSRNRSIAATEMNANSSRAHTIISIEFKQIQVIEKKKREKLSVIYLVDLAGSQKVGKTGATGDRLKEAAGINKSLSVLGLVISTLADKSMGKGKGVVVPYRDSCLTRILQNALGGNSKTLMICAISPATDNYEETLSTLRYADQAKKIQNKAVVNQSETDKIIRNLTAQKEELRDKVLKFEEMFKKLGIQLDQKMLQQLNDAKEQLKFNNMMMKDYQMTKEEKMEIEEKQRLEEKKNKIDLSQPHLSNLNEDPQLSRKINYSIHQDKTKIGRRNADPQNDIQIGGMGIRPLQATIDQEQGKIFIQPNFSGQDSGCYLNGNLITEKIELRNLDRLIFGTNNVFIILIPGTQPRQEVQESKIDTEFAQNELYLKKQMMQRQAFVEKQKKMKEQTEAILRKKEEELALLQKNLQESQQMRKNIEQQKQVDKAQIQKKLRQQEAQKLRAQIENQKKKIKDSQQQHKEKIKDKYFFEKKLLKTLPKCIELNLIAKEFKRNISMSVKMLLPNAEGQEQDIDLKKRSIKVKVVNRESGYCYWWDTVKLSNRYYIIKDMAEQYFETGTVPQLDEKDDPFWDPPEHTLIGRAFLTTKALAYMFDNPVNLTIIGQDDHCGNLVVNLVPTDQTGTKNLSEQMDQDVEFQPQQLIDKPFFFNLLIQEAKIPENYQNIYVEYTLKTDEFKSETFKTDALALRTSAPVFNYVKLHKFDCLSKELLEYLNTAKLIFRVFGYEMLPQEKKQAKKVNNLPQGQSPKQIVDYQVKKIVPESQNKSIVIGTKEPKPTETKNLKTQSPTREEKKSSSSLLTTASQKANPTKTKQPSKRLEELKKKQGNVKDKDKDCIIY